MSISVILPAYKEAENLKVILPKLHESLGEIGCAYEVLVIETIEPMDETEAVCNANNARCINRKGGNNYGDAIRTGIDEARYDYTLVMDADGSHNPQDIEKFYNEIQKSYDLVIGSRYIEGGYTHNGFILKLMSQTVNVIYRIAFNLHIKDVSNSYRLYCSKMLEALQLECDNFDIVEEIIIKLRIMKKKFKAKEVPIYFDQRLYGKTKRELFKFIFSYLRTLHHLLKIKKQEFTPKDQ